MHGGGYFVSLCTSAAQGLAWGRGQGGGREGQQLAHGVVEEVRATTAQYHCNANSSGWHFQSSSPHRGCTPTIIRGLQAIKRRKQA